jgi:ribosomal protein S18 acetylase RimI-like enzyme
MSTLPATQLIKATKKDTEVVWQLVKADAEWLSTSKQLNHWLDYYTKEMISKKIQQQEVYLLSENATPIATISVDQNPVPYYTNKELSAFAEKNAPALYLSTLAVEPSFHGRGIASYLLLMTEQIAKKRNIHYLRFDCRAEYQQLVSFYKKRGFAVVGSFSEGEGQNYFLMEKKIA